MISGDSFVKKKTYVLDTNVLLSDPSSIYAFEDNNIVIPMAVLEELDNKKSRQDEIGKNARIVSRSLDNLRSSGSMFDGVALQSGGTLRILSSTKTNLDQLPLELRINNDKVDNLIVAFMMSLRAEFRLDGDPDPILVSKDINVRLKCDSLGIKAQDYLKMRIANSVSDFYRGVETLEVPEHVIDSFFSESDVFLDASIVGTKTLYPNQILVLKHIIDGVTYKSALAKYASHDKPIKHLAKIDSAYNLKPKNKEQTFALDLLFDENIKLLTLTGLSGSGKTLLALAAALAQLKHLGDSPRYEKIIVTKPVQPVGKDLGYLPGTLEEKMEPWIAPIRDNINYLMGNQKSSKKKLSSDGVSKRSDGEYYLALLQEKGLIEVEAITYIRGRSISNAFIIIDECQNLSIHELKTIVTRVGDNTKIVLTGDIEQIDNVHVDMFSNGLTYAIEKFKDQEIAGHVMFIKGVRSGLATIASKIL